MSSNCYLAAQSKNFFKEIQLSLICRLYILREPEPVCFIFKNDQIGTSSGFTNRFCDSLSLLNWNLGIKSSVNELIKY